MTERFAIVMDRRKKRLRFLEKIVLPLKSGLEVFAELNTSDVPLGQKVIAVEAIRELRNPSHNNCPLVRGIKIIFDIAANEAFMAGKYGLDLKITIEQMFNEIPFCFGRDSMVGEAIKKLQNPSPDNQRLIKGLKTILDEITNAAFQRGTETRKRNKSRIVGL